MDCIAVRDHISSYPDPVAFEPGDQLALGQRDEEYPGWIWVSIPGGRQGWAPESRIRVLSAGAGVAIDAYDARELNTVVGEPLVCTTELNGWLWATNARGVSGWVPTDTVRVPAS